MKICPKCGFKNKSDAKFCGKCQAPLNKVSTSRNNHKKLIITLCGIIIILIAVLLFIMGMNSTNNTTNNSTTNQSSKQISQNHSSASQQSSNEAKQESFSDEEYELMAFLKLAGDGSDGDHNNESIKQLHSLAQMDTSGSDNAVEWHPITNGHRIGFGAHSTELQIAGDNVNVTYDTMDGDHMGVENGHKTYSKVELAKEFSSFKSDIDKALANLQTMESKNNY